MQDRASRAVEATYSSSVVTVLAAWASLPPQDLSFLSRKIRIPGECSPGEIPWRCFGSFGAMYGKDPLVAMLGVSGMDCPLRSAHTVTVPGQTSTCSLLLSSMPNRPQLPRLPTQDETHCLRFLPFPFSFASRSTTTSIITTVIRLIPRRLVIFSFFISSSFSIRPVHPM